MYIFFLNLWIWLQSCPTDGTVAEFLWDNIRCPERSQEWAAMVQDQHKVRQAVLWSRRLPEVTENTETASPILSGTGSCTTLSLFPGLFNSLIRYWEIQSTNILSVLQTDDGEDDLKKGTQLLEIYALEIQMYTAQKNNKKLKVPLAVLSICFNKIDIIS